MSVEVIYKNHKPHGIRNKGGFLLFFTKIYKYPNQEERYRDEINDQFKLSDQLKEFLNLKENLETELRRAYYQGYDKGHNDTVECSGFYPDDNADDYARGIIFELKDSK